MLVVDGVTGTSGNGTYATLCMAYAAAYAIFYEKPTPKEYSLNTERALLGVVPIIGNNIQHAYTIGSCMRYVSVDVWCCAISC